MCYETTARPPMPPIAGGAATGELMVILPDVRGLHAFYEDLALRFAEQGIHSTALDYFGRTAGVSERKDDFDFMAEIMKTHPDTIAADAAAAVAHLRSEQGG